MDHSWTCRCCGQKFAHLPMDYAYDAPRNWHGLTEAERAARGRLSSDLCTIDETEHYVRGCVEIPVKDSPETFIWGVWVSVSKESFQYILARWEDPLTGGEPPRFGWLSNWINGYPEPQEIKCNVFIRSGNARPKIVLEPTDYPLAVEQSQGITLDRIKEIFAASAHNRLR